MRKPKSIRVLLKRPDKDFETVYFDFTAQNMLEYFGVDSLDEIFSMNCLLCKNTIVMNTYSSNEKNCEVFNTVFDGPLIFVGERHNGTYCDISTEDAETVKHWTVEPSAKPKKKRVFGGKFLWEV